MTNLAAVTENWRDIGDTTLDVYRAELSQPRNGYPASPMLPDVEAIYAAARGHSALILAHLAVENQYATTGIHIKPYHFNPLSLRPVSDSVETWLGPYAINVIITKDTGNFLVFRSWADCIREYKRRTITEAATYKGGVYARTTDLRSYLDAYAPGWDTHGVTGVSNDDIDYTGKVGDLLQRFAAAEGQDAPAAPDTQTGGGSMASHRYILSAGHRNTDRGGAAREIDWTYGITKQLQRAIQRRGGQAWIISEEDGDSDPTFSKGRGLQAAARLCVELAKVVGVCDAYISMHYEGGPARGFFGIFPDGGAPDNRAGNPLDERLCAVIAKHVEKTGMPKRTAGVVAPGVMSEKQTGVGAQGYRLGEFVGTIGFRTTTARVILEAGNYVSPADREMLWSAAWQAKYVESIVDGLEEVFGKMPRPSTPDPKPEPKPEPTPPASTLTYPAGMDRGIAEMLFGEVTADGVTYAFNESGIVSQVWLDRGKKNGVFPALRHVQAFDDRRYFVFSDGYTLMYTAADGLKVIGA